MRKRVIELDDGEVVRDQSRGVYGYAVRHTWHMRAPSGTVYASEHLRDRPSAQNLTMTSRSS